ncbi:YkgJ family cysteine cluster protein [Methanolapillus millepedarum]|uniref:YkgJ family cysteine cluster protein n=1 Tax=Methanolapillus millepedarum TaxID=3028296 RepID=A0AA96ZTU1_9EURY|nr:hypothetical protein MsAc7_03860 [Methanosarcinaceae archaeon Ac7]
MPDQSSMPSVLETFRVAGYSCLRCGKCCTRAAGDNSVYLMPDEIESIRSFLIQKNIQIDGQDISSSFTVPLFPDIYSENGDDSVFDLKKISDNLRLLQNQISEDGAVYTFGEMLKRTQNGTCVFLDTETNTCKIYDVRPLLCQTYPFFIDFYNVDLEHRSNVDVIECECDGVASVSETDNSICNELAGLLMTRARREKEDYEKMKKHIRADYFLTSGAGLSQAEDDLKNGFLRFFVCDCRGVFEIKIRVNDFFLNTVKTDGTDEKGI